MFGGIGLYRHDLFFGIIAGDVLYLKVDEANRGEFEKAGMAPFKPYGDHGGTMQYYAVPLDVLESPLELAEWARRAVAAAERSRGRARRPRDGRTAAHTHRRRR
jgi:DNA transformation protein